MLLVITDRPKSNFNNGFCGKTRIQEQGQVIGGQRQKSRLRKVLTVNPPGEYNNSPQARGDYNTRGYRHVLVRVEAQFLKLSSTNQGREGRFIIK